MMKNLYFLLIISFLSIGGYGQAVLYTETFEPPLGADSMTTYGTPGWNINATLAYEGVQSYHTTIDPTQTSFAQTISFSTSGLSFVTLSFAHIAKLSFFDAAVLEISFDNTNWTQITSSNATYLGSGNFSQATGDKFTAVAYAQWQPADNNAIPDNTWWRIETFDISALAGNMPQVWLRFKASDLNNDGSVGNFGWLIDDIKVLGYVCDPQLTAGTASASQDSVCNLSPVTLSLTGHYGDIQWLVSTDNGATWNVATGQGSNTDTYEVNPVQSVLYAAITTLGACVSDTSNIVSIYVEQVVPPSVTGASRCGIGNITLTASGNGTLNWYADDVSTNILDTGNVFNTYVTNTTTFYVSSLVGGSAVDSVIIGSGTSNSATTSGPTYISSATSTFVYSKHISIYTAAEIIAAGGSAGLIEKLGWYKTNANGYTNSDATFDIYIKPVSFTQHATTPIDWNTEIAGATLVYSSNTQNLNTSIGWQDFVLQNPFYWNGTDNLEIFVDWFRPGNATGAVNWQYTTTTNANAITGAASPVSTVSRNNNRPNLKIGFIGGCESPRTPVTATVTFADPVNLSAAQASLCEGQSTTITASSNNTLYNYTWSPSTGLNTTTGASVVASPLSPQWYVVIGDDGNCANWDSIFIDVGPAAIAGTALVPSDTVCTGNSTILSLVGSQGNVQWQESQDGLNWQNATGPGANSVQFEITPLTNTYYQAILTSAGCPADTSNSLFIISLSPSAPTVTGDTRCGLGSVTLTASGNGTLYWYEDTSSTTPINTGPTFSPVINTTTTYYVANMVGGSGGGGSGILISEVDLGGTDALEIMNVSGGPIDVTGWRVAISDSYTNINAVNANVQTLNGIMNPGDIIYWTDGTVNPWGSNMFWNPGAYPSFTGWAMIIDNFGTIKDFVVWEWPSADIQGMNVTIAGFPVTIGSEWSGDGINAVGATAGLSLSRQGSTDNNESSDFNIQATSLGTVNPGLNPPFAGGGCSSPRIPVTATVTTPPIMSVSASSTSICLGDTATLIASSPNTNYVYTWSPAAGLNTTTGDTVFATPVVPTTYVVIGDDGTCGNSDTIFIDYGVSSAANPTVLGDSRCGPGIVNLSAQGQGNIYWFEVPSGGVPVGTGNTYSPNISQTTTFYAQALVGGDYFSVGPSNSGFGNQSSLNTAGWGMTFDVTTTSTLDRVYIYPWASGSVTINLRQGTGPVLQSITVPVTAFTGKTPVDLGWQLIPGTGYRLELGTGSVALGRNTTGASYPYTASGSPVSITGYFNPNPGSAATNYLYFYDWLVSTGCKSQRVPVTGVVNQMPPVPTITQVGPTLVSSSTVNNQWFFEGNIMPGDTSQIITPDTSGWYHVVVDNGGCFQISAPIYFIHIGIEDPEYIALNIYPNPGNGLFNVEFASFDGNSAEIIIYNMIGEIIYKKDVEKLYGFNKEEVDISNSSNGIYLIMIRNGDNKYFSKLVISK